ncbi:uncharacterized protein RCC_08771 [Ramularia collo-cygni]|uniref:Uncharacterized protein n=1 Tax=Ramularia collo-cygni TaxID=112498 RepID=A0A2D3VFZ7_9PEZI|nr:uncharacterized protein RCC_08771 [Ramularia collo-cygni]CZT23061.1 uncharacterized protein RCC_08771 [Ramularia collo-cygni]
MSRLKRPHIDNGWKVTTKEIMDPLKPKKQTPSSWRTSARATTYVRQSWFATFRTCWSCADLKKRTDGYCHRLYDFSYLRIDFSEGIKASASSNTQRCGG